MNFQTLVTSDLRFKWTSISRWFRKLPVRLASAAASMDTRRAALGTVVVLSSLLYIGIFVNLPISLEPWAVYDDGLFIGHAYSIVSGDWLGSYSQLTLIKGPGYPIFLAILALFRFPETLAQALLNCASVGLLSYATKKIFSSNILMIAVFELLLWDFGPDVLRITREALYTPLFVLTFALLLLCLFGAPRRRAMCASLGGLAFGWFWMTREEGIIAVPAFGLLFLCSLHKDWKSARGVGSALRSLGLFASVAIGVLGVVAFTNLAVYDTFAIVDIKGDFEKALGALESVKPDVDVPFVFVPRTAREKIYRVSPTFAQLRRFLDGPSPPLAAWEAPGCQVFRSACGDYGGGWFIWALRDAVGLTGAYTTPQTAADFYRNLRKEIDDACRSGKLSCHGHSLPFMPRVDHEQLSRIPASWRAAIHELTFEVPSQDPLPSIGAVDIIRGAAVFVNVANHMPPPATTDRYAAVPITGLSLDVRKSVIRLYARFLPLLLRLGVWSTIGLALLAIFKRSYSIGIAVILAAWLALLARVAVLVLIDISSFGAILNQYMSYAFPMMDYAALASVFMACRSLIGWFRERTAVMPAVTGGLRNSS